MQMRICALYTSIRSIILVVLICFHVFGRSILSIQMFLVVRMHVFFCWFLAGVVILASRSLTCEVVFTQHLKIVVRVEKSMLSVKVNHLLRPAHLM